MATQAAALVEVTSESSPCLRNTVRSQLTSDVESFLRSGGNIQSIADNVRADPPKKPAMNYGSAPI